MPFVIPCANPYCPGYTTRMNELCGECTRRALELLEEDRPRDVVATVLPEKTAYKLHHVGKIGARPADKTRHRWMFEVPVMYFQKVSNNGHK